MNAASAASTEAAKAANRYAGSFVAATWGGFATAVLILVTAAPLTEREFDGPML